MILIAHNIRSLHNVGSIFRSADAFDVEKLYLTGFTGTPPRKEIAKVALGSEHRVEWEHQPDVLHLIDWLQKSGTKVFALETGGEPITNVRHPEERSDEGSPRSFAVAQDDRAILVGNEVDGIEEEVLDACNSTVSIPMIGQKKSLNVSVATGIALFALTSSSR